MSRKNPSAISGLKQINGVLIEDDFEDAPEAPSAKTVGEQAKAQLKQIKASSGRTIQMPSVAEQRAADKEALAKFAKEQRAKKQAEKERVAKGRAALKQQKLDEKETKQPKAKKQKHPIDIFIRVFEAEIKWLEKLQGRHEATMASKKATSDERKVAQKARQHFRSLQIQALTTEITAMRAKKAQLA